MVFHAFEGGVVQIRTGIVTPDAAFAKQLKQDLEELGFEVEEENGEIKSADLILLDCRAKGLAPEQCDYLELGNLVLAIVEKSNELPVEVFSQAADIIFYPYLKEELYTRLMLVASRNKPEQEENTFEWDGFHIDFANYEVLVDGVKLDLTYKEYELLKHLASSPGRVFTRSQLLKNVWGYDYIEGARTVDVHVRRLRSKLGSKHAGLIETVRHVGYRFKRLPV